MTGLLHTFWRHFVVLTKFPGNDLKCRPSQLLEEVPGSPLPGAGEQRPGPAGVGTGRTGRHAKGTGPRCTHPTHSSPYRASGARFAGWACSWVPRRAVAGCWVVPGITHPVYPPSIPQSGTQACHAHDPHRTTHASPGPLGHAQMTVSDMP